MKHYTSLAWMMAIAIAGTSMTACNGNEPEKPFVTCPEGRMPLVAYGLCPAETRGTTGDESGALFSGDDIEWFNVTTRELRFRDTMEPLRAQIPLLSGIDFYLGDEYLFTGGATLVGLVCSQVFDDLVLCCGKIDGDTVDDEHYYLYDCYPWIPQFINDERVQANRQRRSAQWEAFLKYLDAEGKLKK